MKELAQGITIKSNKTSRHNTTNNNIIRTMNSLSTLCVCMNIKKKKK